MRARARAWFASARERIEWQLTAFQVRRRRRRQGIAEQRERGGDAASQSARAALRQPVKRTSKGRQNQQKSPLTSCLYLESFGR